MEQYTKVAKRVNVLGVAVARVDMQEALQILATHIRAFRAAANQATTLPPVAHVVTANSEIVMMAVDDPEVAQILSQAALIVADGIGLVWAARIAGEPVPERVAGIDMMDACLSMCAREGWRPFFLGAAPGVAEEAAAVVTQRHPGLQLAGLHHGYFSPEQTPQILDIINAAKPDILLVALGAPRQEKWIAAQRSALQVPIAVGVGGSLDGWAGRSKRAPRWMQKAGLEWSYRLIRQPSRALRMTALPRFAAAVLRERLRHRPQ